MATKMFLLVLLVGCSLLACPFSVAAETSLAVDSLWSQARVQARRSHQSFLAIKQAGERGRAGIDRALKRVRIARKGQEKSFFQMEYVQQRALHIREIALVLIDMLADHREYMGRFDHQQHFSDSSVNSAQIKGMRKLLLFVIAEDKDSEGAQSAVEQSHSRMVTLALMHLVTPAPLMDSAYARQAKTFENGLYDNLNSLKSELDFLSGQLQTI